MPTTVAMPKPTAIRSRLGTTFVPNWEKSQRCWNSTRMVDGLGNLGEWALAVHACHAARIASGTAISAATLSVL